MKKFNWLKVAIVIGITLFTAGVWYSDMQYREISKKLRKIDRLMIESRMILDSLEAGSLPDRK